MCHKSNDLPMHFHNRMDEIFPTFSVAQSEIAAAPMHYSELNELYAVNLSAMKTKWKKMVNQTMVIENISFEIKVKIDLHLAYIRN